MDDCVLFYRGSFDPPTLGHYALLDSAVAKFHPKECVIVINDSTTYKECKAPREERERMLKAMLRNFSTRCVLMHSTKEKPIGYDEIKRIAKYANSKLIMVTGVDVLYAWQDWCGNKDKIAVAWRKGFHFPGGNERTSGLATNGDGEQGRHAIKISDSSNCQNQSEVHYSIHQFIKDLNERFPRNDGSGGERIVLLEIPKDHEHTSSTAARTLLRENSPTIPILDSQVEEIAKKGRYYVK